jgi:prevent-host-death family protein
MAKALQVSQDILPIGDIKAHAGRVLRRLRDEGRPVVITQHGRPAGVLLSPEEYDRLREHDRFLEAVHEGLADAEAGRTITDEELGARLDDLFGPLESE